MKNMSIRLRITLWFSIILAAIAGLTMIVVLSVGESVLQKTIRDSLVETVESNIDEIEYYADLTNIRQDNDADQYIYYEDGFLQVDDDYLDLVNGVSTALYQDDGSLLYGENPLAQETADLDFSDSTTQEITVNGTLYYIYDRMLDASGLSGLWLRGIVSEEQGEAQLSEIAHFSLYLTPFLLLLALIGGYFLAGRMLRPIRDIKESAEKISSGHDLKKRIELSPGNDELHQLAGTFNDMFARLDAAFEAERQFTSDVSHELRTPVTVIQAQCEFILEEIRTPEEYQDAIRIIRRQDQKMGRLIEDMLRFIRLEQNAESIAKDTVDLSRLTESVCEDMVPLQEQGISLTWDIEKEITIIGNKDLLSRLLTNLISNAYRYGREDGNIWVTLRRSVAAITLSVKDDGIGIANDQQEKIFNRFYQADPSRSTRGSGLGLSMVQEIARFHGGTVQVESELQKGSTFTVTFPA